MNRKNLAASKNIRSLAPAKAKVKAKASTLGAKKTSGSVASLAKRSFPDIAILSQDENWIRISCYIDKKNREYIDREHHWMGKEMSHVINDALSIYFRNKKLKPLPPEALARLDKKRRPRKKSAK